MPWDSALVLRSGAGNLTATETTASIKIEETPVKGLSVIVSCPTLATGTGPTLDVKIQESNDDSAWNDLLTFKQIVAADTPGRFVKRFATKLDYVRAVLTLGGTTPNFFLTKALIGDGDFKLAGE